MSNYLLLIKGVGDVLARLVEQGVVTKCYRRLHRAPGTGLHWKSDIVRIDQASPGDYLEAPYRQQRTVLPGLFKDQHERFQRDPSVRCVGASITISRRSSGHGAHGRHIIPQSVQSRVLVGSLSSTSRCGDTSYSVRFHQGSMKCLFACGWCVHSSWSQCGPGESHTRFSHWYFCPC